LDVLGLNRNYSPGAIKIVDAGNVVLELNALEYSAHRLKRVAHPALYLVKLLRLLEIDGGSASRANSGRTFPNPLF
jgi:hypothetical protein